MPIQYNSFEVSLNVEFDFWEDKRVDIDLGCVRRRTLQTVSITFSVKHKSLMVHYSLLWAMMCETSLIYVNHDDKHEVQCVNSVRPGVCWQFYPEKRCQEETCQNMSNPLCYTMYLACNTTRTDFCSVLFDLYLWLATRFICSFVVVFSEISKNISSIFIPLCFSVSEQ